ncbi:hypothetical protein [Cellulomonas sp. URHB0016]
MTHQDRGVPEPRVRLRRLLALMRALAGPRGESAVAWHGAGFTYVLSVSREPDPPYELDMDVDPNADHLDVLVEAVRDALTVQP